jgi:DNA-binding NarL/FixJ family response regulator
LDATIRAAAERSGMGHSAWRSARQLAILRLVARDKTNESIAAHLNVSVSTVKHEIQRLLRALRSDDRHGAVAHARALGLFAEPES